MHTTDVTGNGYAGEHRTGDGDGAVVSRAMPTAGEPRTRAETRTRPEPRTRAEARQAIDTTRSRISETLDLVEQRIEITRDQVREKADIARQLRERIRGKELQTLAAAFGVGLAIALLLGGRKRGAPPPLSDEERKALLRWGEDRAKIMDQLRRCARE